MSYLGIKIVTKSEGEINELHIGLGGTMSALFLKQLAQKTHRGLEGRIKAGKSAGGLSFGYKMERHLRPDGTFTTGERSIDAQQAAVIQRIFTDYDRGKSARAIAIELNKEGIAPPRGGAGEQNATWSFSTISGNWKRGTGILNNELYIGRLVWNRQRFIKDPATGKRQARPNPPAAWITEEVPELRIIADDLWLRVKRRQGAIRDDILTARSDAPNNAPKTEAGRRARYLFSGTLACGCCGANYVMISDSRYGCSANRNRGTCDNRKTIARTDVEARVLEGLKHKLMAPELIAEFIAEFQREVRKDRIEAIGARDDAQRLLTKICKDIDSIITAITEGMFHPSMKAKMDTLESDKASLEAQLRAIPAEDPIAIHPGLADIYAKRVAHLAEALNAADTKAEAADILRGLIDKIILQPDPDAANGHKIELHGELGAILSLCDNAVTTNAKARSGATGIKQLTMVAGAGFEPAAFRL